ncbi:hypothetical protein HWV62_34689 [Athelia sp. TMB]|nr:hypothetical protein HWV62_34689 [Athelia sp. TMB]
MLDTNVLHMQLENATLQAQGSISGMRGAPSTLGKIQTASGIGSGAANSAESLEGIWGPVIGKLALVTRIAEQASAIHPYAQTACFVVMAAAKVWRLPLHRLERFIDMASKVIIAQQQRDDAVVHLMETVREAYAFLLDAEPTETIRKHPKILKDLFALTLECAYFIRDYTADKKFRKSSIRAFIALSQRPTGERLANIDQAGAMSKIQQYEASFEGLKRRFIEMEAVEVDIMLLRCLKKLDSIQIVLEEIKNNTITLVLRDLPYADGAHFQPKKACLPGTREFVLEELHRWINKLDGDNMQNVLVLTGDPGFGKSAITHSLAVCYSQVKRLGSYVSFSRADRQRRNPGNVLSTISRDIADLDPYWKLALCRVVNTNYSLAKSTLPETQMETVILGPAESLAIAGPVVIIIDALDESGDEAARKSLIDVLSENASSLPRNFRVLVTARPEADIIHAFSNKPHIKHTCLNTAGQATINMDIAVFIEHQLAPISTALDKEWSDRDHWLGLLVAGSKHRFQWAATICQEILAAGEHGVHYATQLITDILGAGESLDDLYRLILCRKFPERDVPAVLRFKRVMGRILAAKEPLPKNSLMFLCCEDDIKTDFQYVLESLGSLLNGISDSDESPITARHTSFFDFLADERRSLVYSIDPAQYEQHFVRPCLRILSSRLKFNVCELPSSYTTNTALIDLPDRVERFIGPLLAYAARFLSLHLEHTLYDQTVLEGLMALLKENFLHWLEVLSLVKQISTASRLFTSIHVWSQDHNVNFSSFVKDMIRFVETFAAPISQSVPHIYLSALPLAPSQSLVSQTYLPQYPSTARFKVGKLDRWPAMLKTFEEHTHSVCAVAYSPNGKRIASASLDWTIRVRDTETGEEVGVPFRGHTAAVRSIAYSPSGHYIISGSFDGSVQRWDSETGEAVGLPFQHSDEVNGVAYSPDGMYIISCSDDGTICTWSVETGEAAEEPISWAHGGIWCVAYSPDGVHIVSGQDMTVSIWNAVTREANGEPLEGHDGNVNCVVYSSDGALIASCSSDNTIRLWDAKTRQAVGVLEGHTDAVTSVAFSPDGAHLVSGSDDKTIRVWDVKAGKSAGTPLEGHASTVLSVAYSPDGTHIVSGSEDGTVRVWDAGAVEFAAAGAGLQGPSNRFLSMAYSPDGASIVSGSFEGKIQIWDGNTGQPRPIPISGHCKGVYSLSYSPDGTCIVSGCADGTMQVWDALTGEAVSAFVGHADNVYSVAYSPDGSQIVSGAFDGTVRTWDVNSGEAWGQPFKHNDSNQVCGVAYAPDGMHIVSGGADMMLRIWHIQTGEQIRVLSGHAGTVTCFAYSPDGTRIVSGSWDKTICLWDVESGEAVGLPLLGHDEVIESVAFSPDGENIISGSRDRTLRIWGAETRELVGAPIKVHGDDVMAVAYSPDGARIASASRDGTIRIWGVDKMEASADSERSAEFRHDCKLENGWIVTASGQLLLWVPPWNRQGLMWPSNVALIGHSLTELDLADFVHGSDWVSCKADTKLVAAGL